MVGSQVGTRWINIFDIELILDGAYVFRAVKYKMIFEQPPTPFDVLRKEGIPTKLIRNEKGDGMSVEWDKYSSPEETQTRNGSKTEYGVVKFNVGEIRSENFPFREFESINDSEDINDLEEEIGLDVVHDRSFNFE